MIKTFSQFINESVTYYTYPSKYKVPRKITKAFLILWGSTLYLSYDELPDYIPLDKLKLIDKDINELIEIYDNERLPDDEGFELVDWFSEGASVPVLTSILGIK